MKRIKILCAITVSLCCVFTTSQAALIGLYNTGVGAGGTSLADGTIGDPHYSLISVPGGTTDIRVRTSGGGYPIGPWFGDSSTSTWIGPNNDAQVDGPVGTYIYRTTFNLTGLDSSTAVISGGWSTDNDGLGIYLNGVNTGNPVTSFTQFASGYVSFSISGGFSSGVNTLDFYINNGGGPTGLRVEMTGLAAVPEPTTMIAGALLLLPFGLSTLRVLRKTRTA